MAQKFQFAQMNQIKLLSRLFAPVLFSLLISASFSCQKEPEAEIKDLERRITTLTYTLIQLGVGDTTVLSYRDLDGAGGNDAVVEGAAFPANSVFFGTLEVWDESVSPPENITEEVEANSDDFQFFFRPQGLDLTVTYADADRDGNPIGVATAINVGGAGNGNLVINLLRNPAKFEPTVMTGDINNAGGQTEIQAAFPIEITE